MNGYPIILKFTRRRISIDQPVFSYHAVSELHHIKYRTFFF